MEYRFSTLVILLAVAWSLMGCHQRSIPSASDAASPRLGAPAKYSFEVRTDGGSTQESASGNTDLTMGNVHLRVHDGALIVNGQRHGQVKDGDAVLVQADGQVLVNLQVRRPL